MIFIDCGSAFDHTFATAIQEVSAMPKGNNPVWEEVSYRLRLLRLALGYTNQRRWVTSLNGDIKPQDWTNWETGGIIPSRSRLRQIHLKTQAKPDWVLWGDRDGMPHGLIERLDAEEARQSGTKAIA